MIGKLKHYTELDGVRAIAVLMVMFYHFFHDLDTTNQILLIVKKLSLFGKTGVSLFFVLSGFLITRILLKTKENPNYFKSFYMRRILRIFPLYYFFLLIYYFVLPLLPGRFFARFSEQIWYWTFLQNFALTFDWKSVGPTHYWSLAIEEHFYLFWPLVIYYSSLKRIKWWILGLCILSFFTRIFLVKHNIEESQFTLSRFDELALGAFLAILELKQLLVKKNLKYFLITFGLLLIPLVYLTIKNENYSLFDASVRYLVLGLLYTSFIAIVITIDAGSWFKKILKKAFLVFTGKISYGLYVYHPICFMIVANYFQLSNLFLSFILSFGFSYIVSILSYNYFEKKFLRLKDKFNY